MRPLLLVTESLPEDFHTDNIRARYSDLVAEFAESKETVRGVWRACGFASPWLTQHAHTRASVTRQATVEFRVLDAPGFEEHVSDIINRVVR